MRRTSSGSREAGRLYALCLLHSLEVTLRPLHDFLVLVLASELDDPGSRFHDRGVTRRQIISVAGLDGLLVIGVPHSHPAA